MLGNVLEAGKLTGWCRVSYQWHQIDCDFWFWWQQAPDLPRLSRSKSNQRFQGVAWPNAGVKSPKIFPRSCWLNSCHLIPFVPASGRSPLAQTAHLAKKLHYFREGAYFVSYQEKSGLWEFCDAVGEQRKAERGKAVILFPSCIGRMSSFTAPPSPTSRKYLQPWHGCELSDILCTSYPLLQSKSWLRRHTDVGKSPVLLVLFWWLSLLF